MCFHKHEAVTSWERYLSSYLSSEAEIVRGNRDTSMSWRERKSCMGGACDCKIILLFCSQGWVFTKLFQAFGGCNDIEGRGEWLGERFCLG